MAQTFQSGFVTTLSKRAEPTDSTLYLASVPTVTKGRMYMSNGEIEERISFTGVSGSTITGVTRGLSKTADPATAGTGQVWIAGTKIKLVAMHDQMLDKLEGDDALISAVVYADTTVRDAALGGDGVATLNYTNIKTTDDGLFWRYNTTTGQRETYDTGTATPNASETAAGITEVPTQTQADAGEDTLDTGAFGSITPMRAGRSVQKNAWIKGEDAGGDDTYVVTLTPAPVAYVDGMEILIKVSTTNTGACTVDVNSLGVKAIKTPGGNDPQNGDIPANKWKRLRYNGTDFVIVDGHQGTNAEVGDLERATDAEWLTGTSTTLVPNLQQLNRRAVLQTTRAIDGATGAQDVAHGLGVTPKYVQIIAKHAVPSGTSVSYANGVIGSEGRSNFSTNMCSYSGFQGGDGTHRNVLFGNQGSAAIYVRNSDSAVSGRHQTQSATITADGTNVIINWTYSSSSSAMSNNIVLTIMCWA